MLDKCGTNGNGHYDRRGDYFRPGVDPRNSFGRHVETYEQRLDNIQRAIALEAATNG